MQEEGFLWVGGEGHRVTFCFESDLDLLQEEIFEEKDLAFNGADRPAEVILQEGSGLLANLFPDSTRRYDLSTLLQMFKGSGAELVKRLWDEVWQGRITNDTFITLRRALMNRFRFPETETTRKLHQRVSRLRRLSLTERKRGPPFRETGISFQDLNFRMIFWRQKSGERIVRAFCWTDMGSCSVNCFRGNGLPFAGQTSFALCGSWSCPEK